MTKAELDSKHIAELHSLAAEAGVPRYRILRRAELIEKLLEEKPQPQPQPPQPQPRTRERRRPERKRRRLFGRRGRKDVRLQDLLLPVVPGREAIVYAESRELCTALLRELAAELSRADNGPDPIALLIDPSP